MRLLRSVIAVLVCGAAPVAATAQVGDARKPQVDAAVNNAVDGLYREVAHAPLYAGTTVGDLVDKVGGRDNLIQTLQSAQEIGGPRWLDDQTAQVRLEISGTRVARTVLQLAASNPKKSPVPADALAPLLADWDHKTFGAVGTSTGAAAALDVRPVNSEAWAAVPEPQRRQAVQAARANAAQRVIDSLRPVELKPGLTVGQVMDRPGSPASAVRGDLERYLAQRPVTSVQFRADRQVQVAISAPPAELADVLRGSVERTQDPQLADVDWPRVKQDVARALVSGGTGLAGAEQPPAPPDAQSVTTTTTTTTNLTPAVRLPDQPPDWVWRQIDADASARGAGGSALKCARAAEGAALAKLRAQLDALPLDASTLADASRKDPRFADALSRALARARVYKTDYGPDGSATVYVSLDLRDLWDELHRP